MEIVWTEYAIDSLFSLLSFVKSQWGEAKAYDVRIQIQKEVLLLEHYPLIGTCLGEKTTSFAGIRTLIIKKKNKVFYSVKGNRVYIILVWDVRQDPKVLEALLNRYLNK